VILVLACILVTAAVAGSRSTSSGNGATITSTTPATSISTTIYVSAVDCTGAATGTDSGQRAGIQLFGSYSNQGSPVYPFDFAGYYSYCNGGVAVYSPEFLTSDPSTGLLSFTPAGFPISPGDPLELSVAVGAAGVTLTITDVNTGQTKTFTAPDLGPGAGWSAGIMSLFGGPTGSPYLTGSVPLIDEYTESGGPSPLPGPVPFAPVVFNSLTVDGQSVDSSNPNVSSTQWNGSTGSTADVTALTNGSFEATRVVLAPQTVGRTVDIAPVSGVIWIEIPGTHRWVKLVAGEQIPNGSLINANHGSVQLTLALPHGSSETGVFYNGEFLLHQNGKTGATTLTLAGGNFNSCSNGRTPHSEPRLNTGIVASTAKTKTKGKKIRGLWANAHGSFTTKGSNGAAAVLGTKWYTEDTCDGTYFRVTRDKVRVTAYYPHRHTQIVTAGHAFFAPNRANA
jgi:hypothetical protein